MIGRFKNNGHQNFRGDDKIYNINFTLIGDANQSWKIGNQMS